MYEKSEEYYSLCVTYKSTDSHCLYVLHIRLNIVERVSIVLIVIYRVIKFIIEQEDREGHSWVIFDHLIIEFSKTF